MTQEQLMTALGFSAEDLAANRQGKLSDDQTARLRRQARRVLISYGGVLVIVIFAATLFLFFGQRSESGVLTFIGMALTVINAVIVAMGVQSYLRVHGDVSRGVVNTLTGIVTRTVRVTSGRVTTFVLKIDGANAMVVPKPVFNAFEEGKAYTIYRAPASKSLLSAEKRG